MVATSHRDRTKGLEEQRKRTRKNEDRDPKIEEYTGKYMYNNRKSIDVK